MSFFFPEKRNLTKKSGKAILSNDACHTLQCKICPLNELKSNNPQMFESGSDTPVLYILGEGPGEQEDIDGIPWAGQGGRFIREALPPGFHSRMRYSNVVRSRVPKGRAPTDHEIECCRPSVTKDISLSKPKAIIGFGPTVLKWATGEKSGIGKFRGRRFVVTIGGHTCYYYCIIRPKAILDDSNIFKKGDTALFKKDMARMHKEIQTLPDATSDLASDSLSGVRYVTGHRGERDIKKITKWLEKFAEESEVAIDLETATDDPSKLTSRHVRPYCKNSRILTVSISIGWETVGFPIDHSGAGWSRTERDKVFNLFGRWLHKSKCRKIAHNANFELEWLAYHFGVNFLKKKSWHDTMSQAFILDERTGKGLLTLDFLVKLHFNLPLKSLSDVDVKKLDYEPLESVLKYNCLDAKYTHKLFWVQMTDLINSSLVTVYDEQIRRMSTVVLTQLYGLDLDFEATEALQEVLGQKLKKIEDEINIDPIVVKFVKEYGSYNVLSNQNNVKLFKDMLKRKEVFVNKGKGKQKISTDVDVLKKIPLPIARLIVKYRQTNKLKATYVDNLAEDGKYVYPDKKLHPVLNINKVRTRRLSSNDPNEQNFPKKKNKFVRQQVVAPKDHVFVSCDYSQIEVRALAMASKDKALIKALTERTDFHLEWAERLIRAWPDLNGGNGDPSPQEIEARRDWAKGKWVFAAFYGSQAPGLSTVTGISLSIVEGLLKEFWSVFPEVLAWQKRTIRGYYDNGFVELLTGFRRRAPLNMNKIINTPIQGTASDIIMDRMSELSQASLEYGLPQLQPRLQIHDDLSFVLPRDTMVEDLDFILTTMLNSPFDFINVPLGIDVATGSDWYNLTKYGSFYSDDYKGLEGL